MSRVFEMKRWFVCVLWAFNYFANSNAEILKVSLQYKQNNLWLDEITVDLNTTNNNRRFFRSETFSLINPNLVFANQFGSYYADFISSYCTNSNNITIVSNGTLWQSNGFGSAIAKNHILYKYDYNGQQILTRTNVLGKDSYGNDFRVLDCAEKNGSIYLSACPNPIIDSSSQTAIYLVAKLDQSYNVVTVTNSAANPKQILINPNDNKVYTFEEGPNPFWDDSFIVERDDNLNVSKTIVVRRAPFKNNLLSPYDSDISKATLDLQGQIILVGFENPSSTTPAENPVNTSLKVKKVNPNNSQIITNTVISALPPTTKTQTASTQIAEESYIHDLITTSDSGLIILGTISNTYYIKDNNNIWQYDKTTWKTKIFKLSSTFTVEWENTFEDVQGSGINLSNDQSHLLVASTSYVNNSGVIPVSTLLIMSPTTGAIQGKYRKLGTYGYEYGNKVFGSANQTIFMLGNTSSESIGRSLGGPDDIFISKFSGYQKKVLIQSSFDLLSWDDDWYSPDILKLDFPWRIKITK